MKALILLTFLALAGCASAPSENDAKTLLQTLEWEEGECGSFVVSGDVDVGTSPLPWFKSKIHMNLNKEKPCVQRPDTENP